MTAPGETAAVPTPQADPREEAGQQHPEQRHVQQLGVTTDGCGTCSTRQIIGSDSSSSNESSQQRPQPQHLQVTSVATEASEPSPQTAFSISQSLKPKDWAAGAAAPCPARGDLQSRRNPACPSGLLEPEGLGAGSKRTVRRRRRRQRTRQAHGELETTTFVDSHPEKFRIASDADSCSEVSCTPPMVRGRSPAGDERTQTLDVQGSFRGRRRYRSASSRSGSLSWRPTLAGAVACAGLEGYGPASRQQDDGRRQARAPTPMPVHGVVRRGGWKPQPTRNVLKCPGNFVILDATDVPLCQESDESAGSICG